MRNRSTIRSRLHGLKSILVAFFILMTTISVNTNAYAAINFTAEALDDARVKLQWNWVSGAQYCKIYRDGNTNPIKTINIDVDLSYLSYTDTGLSAETTYTYRLDMLGEEGELLDSSEISVKTLKVAAPAIISSVFNVNSTEDNKYEITLKWKNSSDAVKGNIIKGEGGAIIATINDISPYTVAGISTYTFTESVTDFNRPIRYVIASIDVNDSISDYSAPAVVIPIAAPVITSSMSNGTVTVTWKSSTGIENFCLERSKYSGTAWGSWQVVKSALPAGYGSTTDTPAETGTYRYRLSAVATSNYKGFSNISGTVVKTASPANLSCTPVNSGRIDLAWTNPAGNESQILVERKAGSDSFRQIALLGRNATSYSDIYAFSLNTSYTYRVSAYENDGNKSSSDTVTVTLSVPAAPVNLFLSVLSTGRINLEWEDRANNEDGFRIERKTDNGNYVSIATVAKDTTTYSDTNTTSGHTYTYRVYAFNFLGSSSSPSNEASSSTAAVYAPNSLSVTGVTDNSVNLTWSYAGGRVYSTLIERRTGGSSQWSNLTVQPPGVTTYTDTGLAQNTKYYYRVRSISGTYVYSDAFPNDSTGREALTKLGKPLGLSASMASYNSAYIRWYDNSTETEFIVERKRGSGSYSVVATLQADTQSWVDSGLSSNYTYTYRVRARTSSNWSDYSDEYTIRMVPLYAPSNLNVSMTAGNLAVLKWDDNSSNEAGFEIWRKTGANGTWYMIASVVQDTKTYTDYGLAANTEYYYKVRAYSWAGALYSDYTAEAGINTGALNAPGNLIVTDFANYFVKLSWTDNSYNETGFVIERKLPGGIYVKIAETAANTTTYFDKGLAQSTGYYYRVKAVNQSSSSPYTPEVFVRTMKTTVFNDLGYYSWAREAIENMATRGIIKGDGAGVFSPGRQISRAEFTAIMLRSYKLNNHPYSEGFADVPANKWYYKELSIAKSLGIITGDSNNRFYPDAPITREDSANVIVNTLRAAGKVLPVHSTYVLDKFPDKDKISYTALASMATLVGEGVFLGRTDGNIGPKDTAIRAEAAALIYRIIDKYQP